MKSLNDLLARYKHGPSDVVGVDVGRAAVRAVRMHRGGDAFTLLAADTLPSPDLSAGAENLSPLDLPPKLKARYACLSVGADAAVIKLLSFPGHFDDKAAEEKVMKSMGLKDPENYRIAYKVIAEGHGRAEAKVLAVGLPEQEAKIVTSLFPSGLPAPYSLEISPLASLTCFLHGTGAAHAEEAVGVVCFGANSSSFALFNKGSIVLFRTFDVGSVAVLADVQKALGVDSSTAQSIIADGSFDVSQSVTEVLEPLVKQLILSRDFVERRENCHVVKLYAAGDLVNSRDVLDEVSSSLEIDVAVWNPFDGLTLGRDALPAKAAGQEWQFAAAIGACLGVLEET